MKGSNYRNLAIVRRTSQSWYKYYLGLINEVLDHTIRAHTVYAQHQVGFHLTKSHRISELLDSVERGLQNLPSLACHMLHTLIPCLLSSCTRLYVYRPTPPFIGGYSGETIRMRSFSDDNIEEILKIFLLFAPCISLD